MRRQRGFTLMEVLIALAVLAIALGAIIQSIGSSASHIGYLRDKTLAHWVAMNKVAEVQISDKWPSTGTNSGREEMAGHDWQWRMTVTDLGETSYRQVLVEVRADSKDKSPMASLIAVVGKPNT